jgi:acid phosphatase
MAAAPSAALPPSSLDDEEDLRVWTLRRARAGGRTRLLCAAASLAAVAIVAAAAYSSGVGNGGGGSGSSVRRRAPTLLPGSLRFATIGDWGREGAWGQLATARALGELAELADASFIVSVGDNFYENGIDTDAGDRAFNSSWRNVYTHPGLARRPWLAVGGNHDYRGNLSAQSAFSGDARWHFELNYTRSWPLPAPAGGGAAPASHCLRAVFIDTTPLLAYYRDGGEGVGRMAANINASATPAQQYAWLREQLDAAGRACRAVVVVGHHPVYTGGSHGNSRDLLAGLLPLLVEYRVDAYFAGHDHLLNHLVANGTDFVLSGGGSKIRVEGAASPESVFVWERNGFTLTSVNASHMAHSYIDGESGAAVWEVVRPLKRAAQA